MLFIGSNWVHGDDDNDADDDNDVLGVTGFIQNILSYNGTCFVSCLCLKYIDFVKTNNHRDMTVPAISSFRYPTAT